MTNRPHKRNVQGYQTCLICQKEFPVYNSYLLTKRPTLYCSKQCSNKRNTINQTYFSPPLTKEKLVTLGQFIACGYVQNDHTIIIRSDLETITDIQTKLNSTYPIGKSDNGKLKLKISSNQMVQDLGELGLVHNPMFQEFPPYDILEGLLRTDCYKMKDGVHSFRTPSSKLSLEVSRLVSGYIISETYKDVFRGVLGIEYIVIW